METVEELVKSKMLIGTYVMGPGFTLGRGGNPGGAKSGRRERDTVMGDTVHSSEWGWRGGGPEAKTQLRSLIVTRVVKVGTEQRQLQRGAGILRGIQRPVAKLGTGSQRSLHFQQCHP